MPLIIPTEKESNTSDQVGGSQQTYTSKTSKPVDNLTPVRTLYQFDGKTYNTLEEAQKARDEYASFKVTYNGQEYTYTNDQINRLRKSYQMMAEDQDFYNRASTSYTDSDFDTQMANLGLPSWAMWNEVGEFASSGSLEENYGMLTDTSWNKIKELWKEDWEYGLTNEDMIRKAAGIAPVSYDSMYENTMLDAELKAAGLPPAKLLNGKLGEKYAKYVSDYMASGSAADKYGHLTDADWEAINNLWKKDWVYSLSKEDMERKEKGLPPVEYDSMYTDTLMDQQLKAAGLPPSKLLDGKLGEKYTTWKAESENWHEFMDEYVRTRHEYEVVHPASPMNPNITSWYNYMLAKPEWSEFVNEHAALETDMPNPKDKKYIIKDENGDEVYDENGEILYDTAAYENDVAKVLAKNAKIGEDEFAITPEIADQYYNEHANDVLLADYVKDFLETNDIDVNTMTEEQAHDALGYALGNVADAVTLETMFSGADLSEDDKAIYAPVIDKYNSKMRQEGIDAAESYVGSEEYQQDVRDAAKSNIIATYRATYQNTPNANKTDDEIFAEYVDKAVKRYAIKDEEVIRKLRNNEMTPYEYLAEECSTVESANAFAKKLFENYCSENGIPMLENGSVDYDTLSIDLKKHDEAVYYVSANLTDVAYRDYVSKPDISDLMSEYNHMKSIVAYYDQMGADNGTTGRAMSISLTHANYMPVDSDYGDPQTEYNECKNEIERIERMLEVRNEAKRIDPHFVDPAYAGVYSMWSQVGADGVVQNIGSAKARYKYESLEYTSEYSEWVNTVSADYVNRRFDFITKQYSRTTNDNAEKIAEYATEDEKYYTVYLFDNNTYELNTGLKPEINESVSQDLSKQGADVNSEDLSGAIQMPSSDLELYFRDTLMRGWDARRRDDQQRGARYWGQDNESGFVRWAGATGTVFAHAVIGMVEGVGNFLFDTADVISGNEIYSSTRHNASTDRMGALSQYLTDKDGNGVGAFFVQLIPSMIQSSAAAVAAYFTGGATEWITLAAMSSQSYSDGVNTALSRGATTSDAYMFGLAQGAAEMFFEKVSLDHFVGQIDIATAAITAAKAAGKAVDKSITMDVVKILLKRGFVQGLVEGSEEVFTALGGYINEAVILGYNSTTYALAVQHYTDQGYSEEEAQKLAGRDLWNEVLTDGLGGFISGLLLAVPTDLIIATHSQEYLIAKMDNSIANLDKTASSLSAIDTERAMQIANENIEKNTDGKVTKESAQKIVDELRAKGADSATLSYVMNELEMGEDAKGVFDKAILDMKRKESTKLVTEAQKVLKASNPRVMKNSRLRQSRMNTLNRVTNEYLSYLSETMQTSDKEAIAQAVSAVKSDYLDVVKRTSGISRSNGANVVDEYMSTIDEQELRDGAVPYASAMIKDGLKTGTKINKQTAALYGTYAYALTKMAQDARFSETFSSVFGSSTSDIATNIQNACLNSAHGDSIGFVDTALNAIGMFDETEDGRVSKVLGSGMNAAAYVTSVLAACQASDTNSASGLLYRYVSKHGVTKSLLDAMTVSKYYDNMSNDSKARANKYLLKATDAFMTSEELTAESGTIAEEEKNVETKEKSLEAQKESNDQTLAASESVVARHRAALDAVQTETIYVNGQVYKTTSAALADVSASYAAALSDAINARDNLEKANAKRLESSQGDLDRANETLKKARTEFKKKMNRHAAAYMNMIGTQIEMLRDREALTNAEFDRITNLANYGTREDLNDAVRKIVDSEKRQTQAFAQEIGANLSIADFDNKEFAKEFGRDKIEFDEGFEVNGRIYLNEKAFHTNKGAHVGFGVNAVIRHELGHVAELAANNWNAYSRFAVNYMIANYQNTAAFLKREGKNGIKELTAEFTRLELMQNERLITDLCNNAPIMAMRMHQWLQKVTSLLNGSLANTSTFNRAERMFARALHAANEIATSTVSDKTMHDATESAIEANNEMVKANEDAVAKESTETKSSENNEAREDYIPEAPPEDAGAYGFEADAKGFSDIDNASAFTDFNAADYDDEYMQLGEAYRNGRASSSDIARLSYLVQEAAKAKGILTVSGKPEDLYHGTPPWNGGWGFTSFRPDAGRENQKNLTFTATNPNAAFSYTGAERAYPHSRELWKRGKLGIDQIVNQKSEADGGASNVDSYEDTVTWNDYVDLAERTGKNPFDILKDDVKEILGDVRVSFGDEPVTRTDATTTLAIYRVEKLMRQFTESGDLLNSAWGSAGNIAKNYTGRNFGTFPVDGYDRQSVRDYFDVFSTFIGLASDIAYAEHADEAKDAIHDFAEWYGNTYLAGNESDSFTVNAAARYLERFFPEGVATMFELHPDEDIQNIGKVLNGDYIDRIASDAKTIADTEEDRSVMASVRYAQEPTMEIGIDQLIRELAENRRAGMYHLYGQKTENPYEFTSSDANWSNLMFYGKKAIYGEHRKLASSREGLQKILTGEIDTKNFEGLEESLIRANDTNNNAEYARRLGYTMARFNALYDSDKNTLNRDELTDELIFFNQRGVKSADLITVDNDGNIVPLSQRFDWANTDLNHYTEFDAVQSDIDSLSPRERARYGNPRLMSGNLGLLMVRDVSLDGFINKIPYGDGARNIAILERASKYADGRASITISPLSLEDCVAVVAPIGREFADVRNEAYENNATVVSYDLSEPSTYENAIRAAAESDNEIHGFTDFESFIEQYGAYDEEQTRIANGRLVPTQTRRNNRVHRTLHTLANSEYTSDERYEGDIKPYVERELGSYEPVSNNRTLGKAQADIRRMGGARAALENLNTNVAANTGKNTKLLALAEAIYMDTEAMQSFTPQEREQLLTDICLVAEDTGRALQLMRELASLSPQGRINHLEQVGKRMSAKYEEKTGKPTELTITKEELDGILNAKDPSEIDAIEEEIGKRWADQTADLSLHDRIRNWRYLSMLGNPRTHFRNMVGNALMYPIVRTKDAVNAGLQRVFGVDQADRTTTAWTKPLDTDTKAFIDREEKIAIPLMQNASMKYYQVAKKIGDADSKYSLEQFKKDLTQDVKSTHISNSKRLPGRIINKLSSINANALEMEDALALGLRFRSSLAQQIQAKGLDVNKMQGWQKQQILDHAMEEALKATFRDASAVADALNKFENTNKLTKFLIGSTVPFKKTPINIAKRGIEYSPIGLAIGTYRMISNSISYKTSIRNIENSNLSDAAKEFRKREAESKFKRERIAAIDSLSSGITGGALFVLGMIASKLGWVSIGRKDDDQSAFETALGKNSYSLNIGDVSIDLSAFSPAAIPLLMGAAANDAFDPERRGDNDLLPALSTAFAETLDPITEMSLLSGIAEAMSGMSYSNQDDGKNTKWWSTLAVNTGASYVGQFIPTLFGQAARIADTDARSYSAGKDYWASKAFGTEIGSKVKSLQNKIPFVSWLSEPKVDLHGNKVGNYTNWGAGLLHVLNNTILPATIKVDQKNDVDEELIRLYGEVDTDNIFPTKPSRNIGSYTDKKTKEKVTLKLQNDAEYTEYQMEVGQVTYDSLLTLMNSQKYARMSDAQKADAVKETIENARKSVKELWKAKMRKDK